ncbi:MAG: hypothetical protein A2Z03_03680 [Chloroflexi bacterium RBG_16_56_8]|nr:MAG: hypothetical protein A2Z03_03680 [Chloroflexi bacterium RBG_16_56_8]
MDALLSLLKSTIGFDQARMLVLFLIFLPPFFFAYWAIKRGLQVNLRPIAAYDALKALLAQAAEAGQPVHLSLGIAGIGDQHTADTTAGLTVLDYVADRAAVSASPPIVTLSNPTALPVAQDVLRRAYRRHGYPEEYDPARARFIAPDPALSTGISPNPAVYASGQTDAFAYAAGTMRLLTQQPLIANVMVGFFGDEFLLLGETGAQRHLNQIGGTSATSVLPFFYASVPNPLIGEEIFASGAYLSNKAAHIGSLVAQDVMRWLLVAGVVGGIVLKTLGLL